jgi:hypothetical protein
MRDEFRRGLKVTDVNTAGPAYHELLERTDVIVRVLYPVKRDIRAVADLEQVVSGLKSGDLVTLMVADIRGAGTRSVTLRVAQ